MCGFYLDNDTQFQLVVVELDASRSSWRLSSEMWVKFFEVRWLPSSLYRRESSLYSTMGWPLLLTSIITNFVLWTDGSWRHTKPYAPRRPDYHQSRLSDCFWLKRQQPHSRMPRRENNKRIEQILLFFVFFFSFHKKKCAGRLFFCFFSISNEKKSGKIFWKN
jgi:hypothetical protein